MFSVFLNKVRPVGIPKYCFRCVATNAVALQRIIPLDGIKVLDLTRIVAGPYCTMLLGDHGAEIIKVEQPDSGDESRRWGPFLKDSDGVSCYFISLNRNKKSICVDLKSSNGNKVIKDLAKKCDILVENFVPGKLEKFGLGYDELKKIAPHLIYCSITGYGNKGPYKSRPGYDVIAASVGGLLNITGPKDGEPCKPGVAMTDVATGLYAYGAILTALLQRQKTGSGGQKIDCNLLSTQLSCLINVASGYLNADEEAHRLGTGHPSIVPYESFPTADGFITIGAGSNNQFANLCKTLSLENLINDPRFLTNFLRVKNRDILISIMKNTLIKETTKYWLQCFIGCTFPYGPVNSIKEVFEDEHVKELAIVKQVIMKNRNNKTYPIKIKLVGPSVEYSESENKISSPPPYLGEHTRDILKQLLIYSDEKIDLLLKNKDVQ